MHNVSNRLYVVTGAASGLGEASARALHAAGAYVAILDRDKEGGPAIVKELGERASFYYADMADDAGVESAINEVIAYSQKIKIPINGAVNCAGIGFAGRIVGRDNKPFDLEAFKYVLQINLIGTYNVTRLVAAHMCSLEPDSENGERGAIILVSSAAGKEGQTGQSPYSASKGAVNSLAIVLARDLARHQIRVVTIAPTLFDTNMGRQTSDKTRAALTKYLEHPNRYGNADEFGHLVKAMIENTYMNGEIIPITGASRLGKL